MPKKQNSQQITHPEKIYFPELKLTKEDLINYYRKVSPFLLPYLKNRPLIMHRYPNGVGKKGFYQKNVEDTPSFVKEAFIQHKNKGVNYLVVNNLRSLVYAANLGSIEMHILSTKITSCKKPDYIVLDLDPTSISFQHVVKTALVIHDFLDKHKVSHFCKTSGGKGLHILIPTKGKYTHQQNKKIAQTIGKEIEKILPNITSLKRAVGQRQKRVYIDTLQNGEGQMIIAPYSVRANKKGLVSTPISFEELKKGLLPEDFTIENVPKRLEKRGDLLKGLLTKSNRLDPFL